MDLPDPVGALMSNVDGSFEGSIDSRLSFPATEPPDTRRVSEPREASTLIIKLRSCTVRSDLKNTHEISRKCLMLTKIRSYSARSDLKNKSARFPGKGSLKGFLKGPRTCLSRRTLQNRIQNAFKNPSKFAKPPAPKTKTTCTNLCSHALRL